METEIVILKYMKSAPRFLKSDAHEKAKANGKIIVTEYATAGASESGKGIMSKLVQSIIPGKDTRISGCLQLSLIQMPAPMSILRYKKLACLSRPSKPLFTISQLRVVVP